ncbi:extracellular solute-binding protein [Marinicellulosiphila megalodicopiae]|uniref:extracellular solute-binding protein n=1 Tax=Marinicellulosiphila megalodicopiae TaxID=2724896 RepID=UPI003BAE6F6C
MLLLGCNDSSDTPVTLSENGIWYGTGTLELNNSGNSQYNFTVTKDGLVEINLKSEEDAYLVLLDSDYNLVSQNNDSTEGSTNSKINETLNSGTYTIIAASNWLNTFGEFELTVSSEENIVSGLVLEYASTYTGPLNFEGSVLSESETTQICLDLNDNYKCDENEYSMSSQNGEYSFDKKILIELKEYNLEKVRVLAKVSNDEELNYLLVSNNLSDLYISPMNTLLNAYMNFNPMQTKESAQLNLLNELNISSIGLYLFERGEVSASSHSNNMKFYSVSKIVEKEIEVAYKSAFEIGENNSQLSLDDESLHLFVATMIIEKLPEIAQQVEAKINEASNIELTDYQTLIDEADTGYTEVEFSEQLDIYSEIVLKNIEINAFGDYGNYFQTLYEDLNSTANVLIKSTPNSWGVHHNQLILNLENGSGAADVELIDTGLIGGYLNDGALLDLSSEFEMYKNNMVDYAVSQGQNELGQQVAIPVDLGPGVAFYRRDYMEGLGFDLTEVMDSWESWLSYGRTLRDDHDVYLVSNVDGIARAIIYGTVEPGNGIYIGANDEVLVENERFKFAFNMALTLRNEGLDASLGMWNDDWYNGFNDGLFAMEIQGAWLLGHMKGWIAPDTSGLWGASTLPAGIYGTWGGTFAAIPTQSADKKDAAWRAIEYMISPEAQLTGFKEWAMFPANKTVYSDAIFDEEIAFLDGQKARLLFAEIANNVTPILPSKYDNIAETLIVNTALQEVLADGRDIDEALKDAADQLEARMQ